MTCALQTVEWNHLHIAICVEILKNIPYLVKNYKGNNARQV